MSHTLVGLRKQLDVLQAFCRECQLTVNVKKTKVVVFEAHKSMCQVFQYEGEAIEQLNSFKYLGVELHGTKGMQAATQRLVMSRKKGVFALRRKCASLTQDYNASFFMH
jgi:tRNA (Thr-GGU) A37 N-methylase